VEGFVNFDNAPRTRAGVGLAYRLRKNDQVNIDNYVTRREECMQLSPHPVRRGFNKRVSALARAAHTYRSVLFLVVEATGDEAMQAMLKHEDLLHLSDAAINAWRTHLATTLKMNKTPKRES